MSQDPKDPKDHHAEEGIVLRNSAPARVSFNEKTGKAQRKRNIFNDDQAGSVASDETLHEEASQVLQDDERLLHVEDTAFTPEKPLQLEPEQTAGTVLRPESEGNAAHRLQVEHEDADDNRLHLSEAKTDDTNRLQLPEADDSNRLHLPEAETEDNNRLQLPQAAAMEAGRLQHDEDIAADHRERLPEQPPSLLPPDLPSLELATPNVLHVALSPETPDAAQESAQETAQNIAPPPPTPSASSEPASQIADALHQPAPATHPSHRVHLSMNVHQRERLAASIAEGVAIEERLHHAQERVIKLTDQILNGNR